MHLAVIIVYKFVVTRCGSEKQWGGGQGPWEEGERGGKGRGEEDRVVEVMGKIQRSLSIDL